jgi:hypothetical protein
VETTSHLPLLVGALMDTGIFNGALMATQMRSSPVAAAAVDPSHPEALKEVTSPVVPSHPEALKEVMSPVFPSHPEAPKEVMSPVFLSLPEVLKEATSTVLNLLTPTHTTVEASPAEASPAARLLSLSMDQEARGLTSTSPRVLRL